MGGKEPKEMVWAKRCMCTMKKILLLLFFPALVWAQNTTGLTGVRDYSYNNQDALKNDAQKIPNLTLAEHVSIKPIEEIRNLVYKTIVKRSLTMDYLGPKSSKKLPTIMFIHGGGWRTGDKLQHVELAKSLVDKGFRVFLIEYRLSTEALYPAAMQDAHDALVFLFSNAERFKIDTKLVSVAGFSAGGQMAALLGSTWDESLYGSHSTGFKIHGVVDIDGILAFIHPESGEGDDRVKPSAATLYFGYGKTENPTLWNEASALYHVSANDPAVLFINSGVERMHAGREDFRQKMDSFQLKTEVVSFENSPHSFLLYTPWMEQVSEQIATFLTKKRY